jgi:hemolysin III
MRDLIRKEGGRPAGDAAAGIVHMIGGGLALVGLPFLGVEIAHRPSVGLIVGASVYAFFVLYHFSLSAVAHSLRSRMGRLVLGALDDSGSLALLAASWTPFCLSLFKGTAGWILFGLAWGFMVLAFLFRLFVGSGRARESIFSGYYLAFGLLVPLIDPYRSLLGPNILPWTLLAGLLYALGLFFRTKKGNPYNHAIWHAFTMNAAICQYFALLFLAA